MTRYLNNTNSSKCTYYFVMTILINASFLDHDKPKTWKLALIIFSVLVIDVLVVASIIILIDKRFE